MRAASPLHRAVRGLLHAPEGTVNKGGLDCLHCAPSDLVHFHSDSCSHQQAAEHLSSWPEESNSVPVAVHASCMAAVSVNLLEARPTLHCAMLCSLLCWTGLLTAGGAKFDQKALSSTHALGAALEYSAGPCSRSSTRVRSPSLHQRQRIQRSAAASHRHCCSSSNPLLCFCATDTGMTPCVVRPTDMTGAGS